MTTTTTEKTKKYNEYMRKYMLQKRRKERENKRCIDCGSDRVEYRCRLCSECAEIRLKISDDMTRARKK